MRLLAYEKNGKYVFKLAVPENVASKTGVERFRELVETLSRTYSSKIDAIDVYEIIQALTKIVSYKAVYAAFTGKLLSIWVELTG